MNWVQYQISHCFSLDCTKRNMRKGQKYHRAANSNHVFTVILTGNDRDSGISAVVTKFLEAVENPS